MSIPRFIRSAALKYVMISQHHYDKALTLAAELASEEFTKTTGDHNSIRSGSLSIILQYAERKPL